MLLHRGETHSVLTGQGRDRLFVADGAPEDVAPGLVGQGAEDAIDLLPHQTSIYNHMVVD